MKITPRCLKTSSVLIILLIISACNDDPEGSDSTQAAPITVAEVETRDLSDRFTISSEVVAYTRSYIASRVSGLIEDVHYEEGDQVDRGDVMAKLDVRQQQIQLRRARAELEEARDINERNEALFEREAISRAELLASRRALVQSESEVERLELEIEYGTVTSPIKGTITSRLVEPGNNVSANEQLFTVADLELLVIRPGLSEMNLAGLKAGQNVEVQLDVYPDRIFNGSIRRIFPSVDAATRLFTVEVELVQEDDKPTVRPGYLARVRFVADDRSSVLTVPSEAVAERDGEYYIFKLNEDETLLEMLSVEVGIRRDGFAEIRSGVEEGEKVAAANLEALEDGSEVRVVGTFRRYGFRN